MKRNQILRTIFTAMLCLMMVTPSLAAVLMIPSGTKTIGTEAFFGDTSLDEVILPEGIEEIGERAFAESSLKKINLPSSLKEIADNAFDQGNDIELSADRGTKAYNWAVKNGFIDPDAIESSPLSWFQFTLNEDETTCTLTNYIGPATNSNDIIIPSKDADGHPVTIIGDSAFKSKSKLTGNLIIPYSVTRIENDAFNNCRGLIGDLIIPGSVIYIGNSAFSWCGSMTGKLIIPDSVTYIGEAAFNCCSNLTGDLIIPDSVTHLGDMAFAYCKGFTGKLVISDNLSEIGSRAFDQCENLTGELILPDAVTTIGYMAFYGCHALSGGLVIPVGVTKIGEKAFTKCTGLIGDLIIPDSVTSLGTSAFAACGFSGKLQIPDTITCIPDTVFLSCKFTDIHLPETLTSIGKQVFGYNSELVEISLPDGLQTIDEYVFFNCTNLISVKMGEQITSIGETAFSSVPNLGKIYCVPDSYAWNWFVSHGFDDKLIESSDTGMIHCRVKDQNGADIHDVQLEVFHRSDYIGRMSYASNGLWSIRNLVAGYDYSVFPYAAGYTFDLYKAKAQVNPTEETVITGKPTNEYFTMNRKSIIVGSNDISTELEIRTDLDWTIDTDEQWIHLNKTECSGSDKLIIEIDLNNDEKMRFGTMTIRVKDETIRVPVAQLGTIEYRLADPTIIEPTSNGQELPLDSVKISWTKVENASQYVVSLRNLETDNLILQHSLRSQERNTSVLLTPEYFSYGNSYRVAVAAVPEGFASTDSIVSWSERTFKISEAPVSEETWLCGRLIDNSGKYVFGAVVNLYLEEADQESDSATILQTTTTADDGTWVFNNLEEGLSYVVLFYGGTTTGGLPWLIKASTDNPAPTPSARAEITTSNGMNDIGDVVMNPEVVQATGDKGLLWARFYNYSKKDTLENSFPETDMRYICQVPEINFRFSSDTDSSSNMVLKHTSYDGRYTDPDTLAYYLSVEKLGIIFNGIINVPSSLGSEVEIQALGDDGISISIDSTIKSDWNNKGLIDNYKTIKVDATDGKSRKLEIKYYNESGDAYLVLRYRYKIGNKWSEWETVPSEWFMSGEVPSIHPSLAFWDTRELVSKLNNSLENYVDKKCTDIIKDIATGHVLAGITGYATTVDSFNGQTHSDFVNSFGQIASTNIGSAVLNKVASSIGISVGTMSDEEKAKEIKKQILSLCKLKETDDEALALNVSFIDGIKSTYDILELLSKSNATEGSKLEKAVNQILFFNIDPYSGEVYDKTNPEDDSFMTGKTGEMVGNFFILNGFAKGLCDMFTNAVKSSKDFDDTDRIKALFFLSLWNKEHGVPLSTEMESIINEGVELNDISTKDYMKRTTAEMNALTPEDRIIRMNQDDLVTVFSNGLNLHAGINYQEAIYKQLLLDVMDQYFDNVYRLP